MGEVIPITRVKFSVGNIIHHRLFDYRGVIVDVDRQFEGSEAWYESVARSRPPRDKPWYHVLVDGSDHMTYVAERNLESAEVLEPINHPLLDQFFTHFEQGKYRRAKKDN